MARISFSTPVMMAILSTVMDVIQLVISKLAGIVDMAINISKISAGLYNAL